MTALNATLIQQKTFSPKINLSIPDQNLLNLPEKVLQFGTGVLLRGLPDYFIDKANKQGIFNGRVVVVKSTDAAKGSADTFAEQNSLYTHGIRGIEKGIAKEEFIINSALSRILSANEHWKDILQCAHIPEMNIIISNTTEVGIQLVADDIYQMPPQSFPGKLTAFLYERFKAFKGSTESGMVIVPCELVVDNGRKLKDIVLALARQHQLEKEFIKWLTTHNTFCNSLVDRIVPGKPDAENTQKLNDKLGYTDDLLIISEVYRLWAIEGDERIKNILSFAKAYNGVIIEKDITPYRERKLRLLNGTHTISVGLGYLYGMNTVSDCMNDSLMERFISSVMLQEIVPAVLVDEQSAREFAYEVLDRFRNPYIVHPLINITLQYTSKMRMRNVQTLLNYQEKFEEVPRHLAVGFAAYLLFMKAVKEENGKYYGQRNGQLYPIQDDFAAYFFHNWEKVESNLKESVEIFVCNILADQTIWEINLYAMPGLAEAVTHHLYSFMNQGIGTTLEAFLQSK